MQLNFSQSSNFSFFDVLPENFKGYTLPGSQVLTASHPSLGTIVQQVFSNSHYSICYNFFDVLQPFKLHGAQAGSRLTSFLSMKNTINYDIDGVGNLTLKQGEFGMLHSTDRPATANFLKARSYECIEMSWKDEWLRSFVDKFNFLESLFMPVSKNRHGFFLPSRPRPAGIQALDLANTILTNSYDAAISRLFFEIQAREYLLLLLIAAEKKYQPATHLTSRQRDMITAIGERVLGTYDRDFHIADLAREAGINETTFKNGFREIFGDAISRLHITARMQEARRLLADTDLSTKQIAKKVNYRLTTSFIKYFKKFFGYNPSEVPRKYLGENDE